MLHVVALRAPAPGLPPRRWTTTGAQLACAAGLHLAAAALIFSAAAAVTSPSVIQAPTAIVLPPVDLRHIVFVAADPRPGGGGGGGGNRQSGPIRRAEAAGSDPITLRVASPVATSGTVPDAAPLPEVVLDARPLASGTIDHAGLPTGGVSFGTSTGPGSGGGVGDGAGTGIGSGRGPGIGPGSGGGIGGGAYLPGGSVTPPRVILEVKPTYTSAALFQKIQGTVVLELVVQTNGVPSHIRVVRSLDPGGLDEQAVIAAGAWRFEPGRVAGAPVDVLVNVLLDFTIR